MKYGKLILLFCAALFLFGCSRRTTTQTPENGGTIPMDSNTVAMIQQAAGCTESKARLVLKKILELGLETPIQAEHDETASDLSIILTTDGGRQYLIGINKKGYVYTIKDLETGEYLYAVYQ